MDTTDPDIWFDEAGVCVHCHRYDENIRLTVVPGGEGQRRLEALAGVIRAKGTGKRYDCIIGVSGGVDSSFVAWRVKQLGLRPLAVHLDNGWDSELAVKNIQSILDRLGIELYTHVLDWEEFRDLQLAFLRASTPDSEIPSDHAIVSLMYRMAANVDVDYVIAGTNARTESHLPAAWSQGHMDWRYIKGVHRRFGTRTLRTYPHLNLWALRRLQERKRWISILNFGEYSKVEAVPLLERELGYRNYEAKHFESIYTRFYQGYMLPTKFGFDKRKTHLSSLICSGEITRQRGLAVLTEPTYSPVLQNEDRVYVIKKLGLTEQSFDQIIALPPRSYWDYPSYGRLFKSRAFTRMVGAYRLIRPKPVEYDAANS